MKKLCERSCMHTVDESWITMFMPARTTFLTTSIWIPWSPHTNTRAFCIRIWASRSELQGFGQQNCQNCDKFYYHGISWLYPTCTPDSYLAIIPLFFQLQKLLLSQFAVVRHCNDYLCGLWWDVRKRGWEDGSHNNLKFENNWHRWADEYQSTMG